MLLSISLISIAMLNAVVNAQYGDDDPDSQDDDYDSDSQYTQPAHQYGQPAQQYMQQVQQPSQLNFQQPLQPLQALQPQQSLQPSLQGWQQPFQSGSGQWQQNGGSVLQDYQQQSSYTQTPSPSDECGKIADDYGVIPFKTWGKSTESMKTTWGQKGCDQLLCVYWNKKYGVKPFETGGTIPQKLVPVWNHKQMECGYRTGPYTPAQCRAASERFSTYPLGIWGTMPEYAKPLWTQGGCDVKICSVWKAKYGFSKGKTYGTMPGDIKRLWDTPGISCTDKV
ncbi:hypothetical protein BASA83_012295 [Batrachochytrium salamandrivorans]|nr:hypothetical protein BASA83_012295 [Batrachochytrium salamandrivorans]